MTTYRYTSPENDVVAVIDEDGISLMSMLASLVPEGEPVLPYVKTPEALQAEIVAATQARLDAFARTRNYDGILSATTYATSTVPKFQAEGQYAVNARDNTWATLYAFMADVQAGTQPMPSGYVDIEPLLPALEWPA